MDINMILIVMSILGVTIFEINKLGKNKKKQDLAVIIGLAIIALVLGFQYITNPYRGSLAYQLFKLFGIRY